MSDLIGDLSRLVAFPTVSDRPVTELAAFAPAVDVAKVTALNTPHLVRGRNEARWNLCSARR